MRMPTFFSWSLAVAALLLGEPAARAVPLEQKVGFPGDTLAPEHWEVRAGNKAAVVVKDGRLVLRSTPGAGRRRFIPTMPGGRRMRGLRLGRLWRRRWSMMRPGRGEIWAGGTGRVEALAGV